jgi:hypothetical protein
MIPISKLITEVSANLGLGFGADLTRFPILPALTAAQDYLVTHLPDDLLQGIIKYEDYDFAVGVNSLVLPDDFARFAFAKVNFAHSAVDPLYPSYPLRMLKRQTFESIPNESYAGTLEDPVGAVISGSLVVRPVPTATQSTAMRMFYVPVLDDLESTGEQELAESDFATHTLWTETAAGVAYTAGQVVFSYDAGQSHAFISQAAANRLDTAGNSQTYRLSYDVTANSNPSEITLNINTFSSAFINLPNTVGHHVVSFTSASDASTAAFILEAWMGEAGDTISIDNLYLGLEDQYSLLDRSLKTLLVDYATKICAASDAYNLELSMTFSKFFDEEMNRLVGPNVGGSE